MKTGLFPDSILMKEPLVLALSLDKKRQKEHIIFGPRSQVASFLSGINHAALLYNEKRPLGTFLLEHDEQSAEAWNSYVHAPLSRALLSFGNQSQTVHTAMEFLKSKQSSKDAVCSFAANISLSVYNQLSSFWGSDESRTEYLKQAANFSRSFKTKITENKKPGTIIQALDRIQKTMRLNGLRSDSTAQIWYPNHMRSSEWIIISESFYPAILYYLRRMKDWGMCFCRCSMCGKIFISSSLHHSLCSEPCRQARNRQNKQEFDERARVNGYDRAYKNTTQRMRNRLNKLNKQDHITDDQMQQAQQAMKQICKEALQKKKTLRTEPERRSFRNWLLDQEQKFDKICNTIAEMSP